MKPFLLLLFGTTLSGCPGGDLVTCIVFVYINFWCIVHANIVSSQKKRQWAVSQTVLPSSRQLKETSQRRRSPSAFPSALCGAFQEFFQFSFRQYIYCKNSYPLSNFQKSENSWWRQNAVRPVQDHHNVVSVLADFVPFEKMMSAVSLLVNFRWWSLLNSLFDLY